MGFEESDKRIILAPYDYLTKTYQNLRVWSDLQFLLKCLQVGFKESEMLKIVGAQET